ncbi:MAG: Lrp/AsnC family transcriptional regulator [Clostridiales bacterium]|nr:Lrp/AsnC family transcriptional regulator [Clostridiales bacterium]
MKTEILKLLEKDCRLTAGQIASMLGASENEVVNAIAECEADGLIIGYMAQVDWDKAGSEAVTALIEVKVTPQRGDGYERIAERIYQYEEVESTYLMSGAYDLCVIISGRTLKEVAAFVSSRLSTIDGVSGTATHFILKKYKEKHLVFEKMPEQQERMVFF